MHRAKILLPMNSRAEGAGQNEKEPVSIEGYKQRVHSAAVVIPMALSPRKTKAATRAVKYAGRTAGKDTHTAKIEEEAANTCDGHNDDIEMDQTGTGDAMLATGVDLLYSGSDTHHHHWLMADAFHTAMWYTLEYAGEAITPAELALCRAVLQLSSTFPTESLENHLPSGTIEAQQIRASESHDGGSGGAGCTGSVPSLDALELLVRLALRKPLTFTIAHLEQRYGNVDVEGTGAAPLGLALHDALDALSRVKLWNVAPARKRNAWKGKHDRSDNYKANSSPIVFKYAAQQIAQILMCRGSGGTTRGASQGEESCDDVLRQLMGAVRASELRAVAVFLQDHFALRRDNGSERSSGSSRGGIYGERPARAQEDNNEAEEQQQGILLSDASASVSMIAPPTILQPPPSLHGSTRLSSASAAPEISTGLVPTRKAELIQYIITRQYRLSRPGRDEKESVVVDADDDEGSTQEERQMEGTNIIYSKSSTTAALPMLMDGDEAQALTHAWHTAVGDVLMLHPEAKAALQSIVELFHVLCGEAVPLFQLGDATLRKSTGVVPLTAFTRLQVNVLLQRVQRLAVPLEPLSRTDGARGANDMKRFPLWWVIRKEEKTEDKCGLGAIDLNNNSSPQQTSLLTRRTAAKELIQATSAVVASNSSSGGGTTVEGEKDINKITGVRSSGETHSCVATASDSAFSADAAAMATATLPSGSTAGAVKTSGAAPGQEKMHTSHLLVAAAYDGDGGIQRTQATESNARTLRMLGTLHPLRRRRSLRIFRDSSTLRAYREALSVFKDLFYMTDGATTHAQKMQAKNAEYLTATYARVMCAVRCLTRDRSTTNVPFLGDSSRGQASHHHTTMTTTSLSSPVELSVGVLLRQYGLGARHLLQFTPLHRYYCCLELLYPLLQSIRHYAEANTCLEQLLEVPVYVISSAATTTPTAAPAVTFAIYYLPHKRGEWWHRLAMNLTHMKQHDKALRVLEDVQKSWNTDTKDRSTEAEASLRAALDIFVPSALVFSLPPPLPSAIPVASTVDEVHHSASSQLLSSTTVDTATQARLKASLCTLPVAVQRRARLLRALWPEEACGPSIERGSTGESSCSFRYPSMAVYHAIMEHCQACYCRRQDRLLIESLLASLHKKQRKWTPLPQRFTSFTDSLVEIPVLVVVGMRDAMDSMLWRDVKARLPPDSVEIFVLRSFLDQMNSKHTSVSNGGHSTAASAVAASGMGQRAITGSDGGGASTVAAVWRGLHCEGAWIRYIAHVLLLDCYNFPLTAPLGEREEEEEEDECRDKTLTWLSPFQDDPLDVKEAFAFLERRRGAIEARLNYFETCSTHTLLRYARRRIRGAVPTRDKPRDPTFVDPREAKQDGGTRDSAAVDPFLQGGENSNSVLALGYSNHAHTGVDTVNAAVTCSSESSLLHSGFSCSSSNGEAGGSPYTHDHVLASKCGLDDEGEEEVCLYQPPSTLVPATHGDHEGSGMLHMEGTSNNHYEAAIIPLALKNAQHDLCEAKKVDVGRFPLLEVLRCVPRKPLIQLLRCLYLSPLSEGYSVRFSGFPDLILWEERQRQQQQEEGTRKSTVKLPLDESFQHPIVPTLRPSWIPSDDTSDSESEEGEENSSSNHKEADHVRFRLMEVKSPSDVLSTKQITVNDCLKRCGFDVSVVRVVDVDAEKPRHRPSGGIAAGKRSSISSDKKPPAKRSRSGVMLHPSDPPS